MFAQILAALVSFN